MWEFNRAYPLELYHYGVKGMKWGVRRSRDQLRYNPPSIIASVNRQTIKVVTANGELVAKMSTHAGDQAKARKISSKEIVDSLKSPLYIKPVKLDKQGRPSQQFIGKHSTVCINPNDGTISSIWKTGAKIRKRYSKNRRS